VKIGRNPTQAQALGAGCPTHLLRAPCEGAISQWGTDPPGNFRFGR
jgi:hypothetical protein